MQTTENLGLELQEVGDFADIEKLNENFEKLDSEAWKVNSAVGNKMDKNNPAGTGAFSMNRRKETYVGDYSFAEGANTQATGTAAHTEGSATMASGNYAHAEGDSSKAKGVASHAEGEETTASGEASHAEGMFSTASGNYSHAEGGTSTASGETSHAEGTLTNATADCSHAEGSGAKASAFCSHAEGYYTEASGFNSHAEGYETIASEYFTHAQNYYTIADAQYGTAIGTYNKRLSDNGLLFAIGNGYLINETEFRSNAMSVNLNGVVKAASTITASTTADYAEFFEWVDSNVDGEDRVGKFVTLDGNKIRIATDKDDYILGVISGEPFVLGNGDCDVWNGMYLRDKFRRRLLEPAPKTEFVLDENGKPTGEQKEVLDENGNVVYEGERLVLNPEYDNTKPYISRADRPEWDAVGMLGVLPVIHDGTAKVNGYVTVNKDGIATACEKSHENAYRVIHVNAEDVVEIIFR